MHLLYVLTAECAGIPVFTAHLQSGYRADVRRGITRVHLTIRSLQGWIVMQAQFPEVLQATDVRKVSAVLKLLLIQQKFQHGFFVIQTKQSDLINKLSL